MNHARTIAFILLGFVLSATTLPVQAVKRRAVSPPEGSVLRFTRSRTAVARHSSLEPASAMTIQFVIYPTATPLGPNVSTPLRYRTGTRQTLYQVHLVNHEGSVVVRFDNNTGDKVHVHGKANLPRRVWTRVTIVVSGTSGRMFFDSTPVSADVFSDEEPQEEFSSDRLLQFGGNLHAAMRSVRMWNRALSDAEVASLATGEAPSAFSGLVADWPLDDGTGRVARDLGPNAIPLEFPAADFGAGDQAPLWVQKALLDQGPFFDLVRYAHEGEGVNGARESAALDFTADGLPDLIDIRGIPFDRLTCTDPYFEGSPPPSSFAFHNLGGETFSSDPGLLSTVPSVPFHIFVEDFTGDGRDDVLDIQTGPEFPAGNPAGLVCGPPNHQQSEFPGGQSRLLVGQAGGGLRDETDQRMPPRLAYDHGGNVGDLDGDGDLDILLIPGDDYDQCTPDKLKPGARCPVVLINDGLGFFTEDHTRLPLSVSTYLEGLESRYYISGATVDVDNDGDRDIVLGMQFTEPSIPILLNDGSGHFARAPASSMPVHPRKTFAEANVTWLEPGDFDRDGWQDLVVGSYDALVLYLNNRDGTFRIADDAFSSNAGSDGGYVCRAADLNGDGWLDVLCEELPYDRILFNRGNGTFVEMPGVDDFDQGASHWPVDADGDGDLDLMGTDCCTPGFFVMYQRKSFRVK